MNQKSRLFTSTGSLLPVGLLGVFPLRGVFAEAGVFGLNGNKMSIPLKKILQPTQLHLVLTLVSLLFNTDVFHHRI